MLPPTGELRVLGSAYCTGTLGQAALAPQLQRTAQEVMVPRRVSRAAPVFRFVYGREQTQGGNGKMIECAAYAAALPRAPAWQALSLTPRVVARV
jgi:hypothetical protein